MRVLLSIVTVAALGLAAGCDNGNDGIGGSGFIEATSIVVSSETSGRLEVLYVGEGDATTRGAAIGVIDSSTVKLQLNRALAHRRSAAGAVEIARIKIEQAVQDAGLARKEFDRTSSLMQKGSANRQQYDRAENRLEQSGLAKRLARASYEAREADLLRIDAEIALIERRLENCYPTAPVTGTVINKFAEPGELLGPGKPIIEVAKTDTVWVKIYLPAGDLTAIRIGETVAVDPEDGRESPLEGRVVWISEEAEFTPKNVQTAEARAGLVYAVKVNISNPDGELKIGMPVMVRFER